MTTLTIHPSPVPLVADARGRVRVAGTRIPLERVVFAHKQGHAPAEIAADFPTLDLGDVHAVICYYLHHRDEVDAYCAEVERKSAEAEYEAAQRVDHEALRLRLKGRLAAGDAPSRG